MFSALKFNADGSNLSFSAMAPGDAGSQRIRFTFGSDQDDPIAGMDVHLGDHLYGGGGNDAIDGKGGSDYAEGNIGDDSLTGGKERPSAMHFRTTLRTSP